MITWMAVIVGFAAVILVARPGFGTMSGYMIFPLIGALFFAAFQLVTRWLRAGGETAHTTLAWTLAVGAVISAPFAFLTWVPVSAEAWLLMAGLGIVFGLAQALMVRAYAHASAGVLTPFSYAQLVAAAIIGMVVFAAVPDVWTVVGIIMITIAGITVARARRSWTPSTIADGPVRAFLPSVLPRNMCMLDFDIPRFIGIQAGAVALADRLDATIGGLLDRWCQRTSSSSAPAALPS